MKYKYLNEQQISNLKEKYNKKEYKKIKKQIEQDNKEFLISKRKEVTLLDNINGYSLDEYQSNVILSNEKSTLVLAGAGSGKSLTIIGKIVYLVKYCNINPKDILCISFTNEATINLKNNIKKNYNFDIDIYTFHKLSLEILSSNKEQYEISPEELLDIVIDEYFNKININIEDKEKRLIKTFINLFKSNNYQIDYFLIIIKKIKHTLNYKQYKKDKKLLLYIINIYLKYEEELNNNNYIDFNDMINKCIESLSKKGLNKKWKYIIIDEYQDTSYTKFLLIKKIIELTNANLLAVGDDFQSIYRFTGCDLNIFLNFNKYFEYSKIFQIVNTYRNPQELINIAGSFIMKNKKQQRKQLISKKHLNKPIKIYYTKNNINTLKYLLNLNKEKEILVIGRNNKDINNYIDKEYKLINDNIYIYNNIKFKYLTIHKSKGLESEIVIIINLTNNKNSLPTKIEDEKLLKYVNNTKDYYPYEEERRLFYVALTRTKTYTYLIAPYNNYSIFIKELKQYRQVEQIKK